MNANFAKYVTVISLLFCSSISLAQTTAQNTESFAYVASADIVLPGRLVTGRWAPFLVVVELSEGEIESPVMIQPGQALDGAWEITSTIISQASPSRLEIRIAHPDNPGFNQVIGSEEFLPAGSLIIIPEGGLNISGLSGATTQLAIFVESIGDGFPMTSDVEVSMPVTNTEGIAPQLNYIGGSWNAVSRNGEGLVIDRLEGADTAVVFYFTYDDMGEQQWFIGVGDMTGNQIIFPEMTSFRGGIFGDAFDPELVESEVAGSMTVTMPDCDTVVMAMDINNVVGEYTLGRTYLASGQVCEDSASVQTD